MTSKCKNVLSIELNIDFFYALILWAVGIFIFIKLYALVIGLYVAFLIAAVLKRPLEFTLRFTNNRINSKLVSFLIYIILVSGIFVFSMKLLQIFISQFVTLLQVLSYPETLHAMIAEIKENRLLGWIAQYLDVNILASALKELLLATVSVNSTIKGAQFILGGIPYVLFILLASWYFLTDKENLISFFLLPISDSNLKQRIKELVTEIESKLGRWAAAQLSLMFLIGFLSFVALRILGINYALSLAIIAGILELIPNLGPLIALIPAALVALLSKGIWGAILVIVAYTIIQQLENMFIVPHIMGEVVGLHPLIVLIAISMGQQLAGISGALLAIPTLVIFKLIITSDLFGARRGGQG